MSSMPSIITTTPSYSTRDPGGVNPSGVELTAGEDPIGVRSDQSSPMRAAVAPPTPTRRHTSSTTPVMALLVGSPPPPPPSDPPTKKSRSSSRGRSSSRQKPRSGETIPTVHSVEDTISDTSGSPTMKGGTSVVERRRQAALAIYESERLVLDPPEDGTVLDDRLAKARELSATASVNDEENSSHRKFQPPPSPMSAATEPHNNHAPLSQYAEQNSQYAEQNVALGDEEKSIASTPSKARKQRTRTPERIRRALTPERRKSKTPESRRPATPADKTKEESPDKNKRGFFRKIFGGKKKDRSFDDSSEATKTVTSDAALSKKSRGRDSILKSRSSGSSKDYTNTSGSKDYTNTSGDDTYEDRDRPEVFFASDEISTLTNPTIESSRRKDPLDPLDRVDSDQTSDPMGRYWNHFTGSEETDSKDDGTPTIDPFTEPFFREPAGASPVTKAAPQKKAALRINVPEVNDPVGDSPLNSRPAKIDVATSARKVQDPSPRGFQTESLAEDPHRDPLGESPLHKNQRGPTALRDGSPYADAADPPLYRGPDFDDPSVDEEKKDDETDALKAVPPPPPPPPPPRAHSRVIARIPLSGRSPRMLASPNSESVSSKDTSKDTINMSAYRQPTENSSPGSIISAKSYSPEAISTKDVQERVVSDETLPTSDNEVVDEEKSVQDAPSTNTKLLTISSAAQMNAQAVAYLHTLNGEPSPRHAWHQAELSDDETSPANALQKSAKTAALHQQSSATTKPSSSDTMKRSSAPEQFFAVEDEDAAAKLFSAYSGKFKGRKLLKASSPRSISELSRVSGSFPSGNSPRAVPTSVKWQKAGPMNRDVSIKNESVVMGISLLREQREDDIASGKATRVVVVKTRKAPVVQSYFGSRQDPEPKDPIQRAGRRLLSKAAIPIQSSARRFLAQRAAVDRMWALIEIQSYLRRFKSQASLLGYRRSARNIQAVFRGSRCRSVLHGEHVAATQIQKIVRGYLAAASTYDTVYCIILVQARARGELVRRNIADRAFCALDIQKTFRGFMARSGERKRISAAVKVQALWRSYSARMLFQFVVVDVIISQNIARRWMACRLANVLRGEKSHNAAVTIQAMWRGFQGYTDYIFALVDVLVVQRTARIWLAKQKALRLRKELATLKVQTQWRRYSAQMHMLYDLVHIIMVQSLVRRKLAKPIIALRRIEADVGFAAAVKIQSAWRGFWRFSHYVIMQYEIVRLQALVRGRIIRQDFSMHLGCCIMIQSVARRYLAVKRMQVLRKSGVLVNAAAKSMREKRACEQIQFWWRVVLDCRVEKYAALVIERFFLSVKEEVDREIRRVERKKYGKTEQRRRKKKEADEKLLERVWLNTVDENHVDVFGYSPSESMTSRSQSNTRIRHSSSSNVSASTPSSKRSASVKRSGEKGSSSASPHSVRSSSSKRTFDKGNSRHRASSPTMNLVMRHEYNDTMESLNEPPTDSLNFSASDDASEVSGMTFQSLAARQNAPASRSNLTRPQLTEDLSLEEAYLDAEVRREKEKKKSTEKYLKMYGIKTAPSHSSKKNHFFADGAESPSHSSVTSRKSLSSLYSSRSNSGTPRTPVEPPGHRVARTTLKSESPRHGKVLASSGSRDEHHVEYNGEEFGLI